MNVASGIEFPRESRTMIGHAGCTIRGPPLRFDAATAQAASAVVEIISINVHTNTHAGTVSVIGLRRRVSDESTFD